MTYDYIRNQYGVTPVPGHDVQHTITGGFGVIRPEGPSHLHYVKALFHGDKHAVNCHPTELVSFDGEPKLSIDDGDDFLLLDTGDF